MVYKQGDHMFVSNDIMPKAILTYEVLYINETCVYDANGCAIYTNRLVGWSGFAIFTNADGQNNRNALFSSRALSGRSYTHDASNASTPIGKMSRWSYGKDGVKPWRNKVFTDDGGGVLWDGDINSM